MAEMALEKAAKATRLLVVDDEPHIQFALSEYFDQQGCHVDIGCNLDEAKRLIRDRSYSVIIADLSLSGTQGVEGLDVVSYAREQRPGTPVILLTAHGSPEIEREARRLGVDAFLLKPKPLAELARLVFELEKRAA